MENGMLPCVEHPVFFMARRWIGLARSVMERDGRRMNGIPFSVITVSFADFMFPAIRLLGAVKRIDGFRQPLPIDDIAAPQIAEREAEHVDETGERPDGE
ncbi:hypothetical protein LG52_1393 [Geobacillus kaustophilus]|uniref:Uncharacterized protein n=1 Tax=Geobacillus kaustophilus TaxID=1462 RepID=A0A0D8BRE9_GEOKU|nr:hypothetical protein LG52_1393 [Geobacillus kaustophilus]